MAVISFVEATEKDIATIQGLAKRIWPKNYATILPPEQIDYMMHMMYSSSAIANDFKHDKIYYIIQSDRDALGYFCLEINYKNEEVIYIHKIYILATERGKGIGKKAITFIEEFGRNRDQKTLQLNVNRHNKAKQFYERLGFSVLKEEDIDIGNGYWMNDYVMTKKL